MGITLLSTVVAPAFAAGTLSLEPVAPVHLPGYLRQVDHNFCGHPVTDRVLRDICPSLPVPERAFWDGSTLGLAIRPKGGVRGAVSNGDTQVTLSDLEAVLVTWTPAPVPTEPVGPQALVLARAREVARKRGTESTPLADVAGDHGQVLSPGDLPAGVMLETPVHTLAGGYNGKRPLYLVGESTLAYGTHYGNASTFNFVTSASEFMLQTFSEALFSPAERSRLGI